MEKRKVCLTGATGHVGFAILKELQNYDDRDVRILIRKDPGYFGDLRCEKVKGDITDYNSLVAAFEGCDTVYHVAGFVEIKPGHEGRVYSVNVNGTVNVIKACKACGVKRLVYMSSVDTYPPLPGNEEMTEIYSYSPEAVEGTYGKTKAWATQLVLDNNGVDGLETVVCQPSACIGPYDFKISSVGSMIRMFSTGKFPITMTFGGYNFVDVRDVAKGTIAAGDKAKAGEVYILCGKACTVDDFITTLAKVCGNKAPSIKIGKGIVSAAAPAMEVYYKLADKTPIFTRYAVRKLCSNCNFSYEHAAKDLGYSPRTLEESLKDTVEWLKEAGQI
jgi:dihydroflavonol-4-reductase